MNSISFKNKIFRGRFIVVCFLLWAVVGGIIVSNYDSLPTLVSGVLILPWFVLIFPPLWGAPITLFRTGTLIPKDDPVENFSEEDFETFEQPVSKVKISDANPYDRANKRALRSASGIYVAQCRFCNQFTDLDAGLLARHIGSSAIDRSDKAKRTMMRGANMSFSSRKQSLAEQMRLTMLAEQAASQRGFFCRYCQRSLVG